MDFRAAVRNGCFSLHLASDTKQGVIEEMVDLMVRTGRLSAAQRDEALKAVLDREEKMSTGVQQGIAIPHGKIPSMNGLIAAVCLKREGIDFGALDSQPSRIFVMTVSTTLKTGPHLQFLSEICKLLESEEIRNRLLAAQSELEMIEILGA
jgi:mannitol/fructose-specific phosphotransferase system IIA component (Ntr-type)